MKRKKILYVEFHPYHEEVMLGMCEYFNSLDYDVSIFINEDLKDDQFEQFIPFANEIQFLSVDCICDFINKNYSSYDHIFVGSMDVLKNADEWKKINVMGIVHRIYDFPRLDEHDISADNQFTLMDFDGYYRTSIPLTSFGNFKPNLSRKFSNKVMFASRKLDALTQDFMTFIRNTPNVCANMTTDISVDVGEVPSNLMLKHNVPPNKLLKMANTCNYIFISISKDSPVLFASGSFQIARSMGLVPIFNGHDTPEKYGFPSDCCITYETIDELSDRMSNITKEEYLQIQKRLIEHSRIIREGSLKTIRERFENMEKKKDDKNVSVSASTTANEETKNENPMKLQILIPQYKEKKEVLIPLLDSLKFQQGVDLNKIGVVIVNDGYPKSKLPEKFLKSYPFKIDYYLEEHRGVSGTRNACLDHATADYVMFCDADDMFFSMVGLHLIFREMEIGFDALMSKFYEEIHTKDGNMWFTERSNDRTFVHGKVYRRQNLIDNKIRFNDKLTVHEDSYFNMLATTFSSSAGQIKYMDVPYYLWKWRADSVCRHDPLYMQKTYKNYIDSITALIEQLYERAQPGLAKVFICRQMFDTYYLMNTPSWLEQDNQEYRIMTEKRFKEFYDTFSGVFNGMSVQERLGISNEVRAAKINEGMGMEKQTFDQWIEYIKGL